MDCVTTDIKVFNSNLSILNAFCRSRREGIGKFLHLLQGSINSTVIGSFGMIKVYKMQSFKRLHSTNL